tara:strand:+ start:23348 stop:23989 length:642 start_codon:yes stop_codon:yes gene_type:complete
MVETVIVRECKYGQVRVLYGNMLRVEGDLLVTTANNRLGGREGLDEKIHQKAGPELREFCHQIAVSKRKENLQPCKTGEAVTTPGFNLPFENIVHVVGPDCRRPNQDNFRRDLLKQSYASLFREIEGVKKKKTLVMPPISMDVFAYPHREGARMTMEIVLAWMDEGKDPGVDMVLIVTDDNNFLNNMKTVYRESEDRFPGIDKTRAFRRGKYP